MIMLVHYDQRYFDSHLTQGKNTRAYDYASAL